MVWNAHGASAAGCSIHSCVTATVRISASSSAIRGNSQWWGGREGDSCSVISFLQSMEESSPRGITSRTTCSSNALHAACNFSASKMAGSATLGWEWKLCAAFEVTGYKNLITGARRSAGKSFLRKHGSSLLGIKQQLPNICLLLGRVLYTSRSPLFCEPARVII